MDDELSQIIAAIVVIAITISLIKGGIKTFRRNWVAALILLLLLFPIWVIWAFLEMFTGDISKSATPSPSNNQNVHVTFVSQTEGPPKQFAGTSPDDDLKIIDSQALKYDQPKAAVRQKDTPDDSKECLYCAETIKKNAIVCRYCNRDLVTADA